MSLDLFLWYNELNWAYFYHLFCNYYKYLFAIHLFISSMVKHEDVDEENAQENFYYNMADTEDSSEVPGREESDDNNGKNKLICADSTIF